MVSGNTHHCYTPLYWFGETIFGESEFGGNLKDVLKNYFIGHRHLRKFSVSMPLVSQSPNRSPNLASQHGD